jgi:hypothetical protein
VRASLHAHFALVRAPFVNAERASRNRAHHTVTASVVAGVRAGRSVFQAAAGLGFRGQRQGQQESTRARGKNLSLAARIS